MCEEGGSVREGGSHALSCGEISAWMTPVQRRAVEQDRYLRPLFHQLASRATCVPPLRQALFRTIRASERTIDRHARRALGSTLRLYLDRVRVLEAVRMLCVSDEKLVRIADAVGCSCAGVLQRSLRRHLGLSPREIRACAREGFDAENCLARGDVRKRHIFVRKRLLFVRKRHISPLAPAPEEG